MTQISNTIKPYYEEENITIYNNDCLQVLSTFPDNSFSLIITSPPYNVGMPYGVNDRKNYEEYINFVSKWLKECYRILISGGRIAINLPSSILQSSPSRPSYLALDYVILMREIGFLDREWAAWLKMKGGEIPGKSTSWGSWCSPSSPYLRDASEYIIIMDKESHKRTDKKGYNDVTKEEFLKFTTNCWYMQPEHNRKHPAPFPEELPYRLMKLYSWQDDLILDPFLGSGTTLAVAKKLNRKAVGIEISKDYCEMSKERIQAISTIDRKEN